MLCNICTATQVETKKILKNMKKTSMEDDLTVSNILMLTQPQQASTAEPELGTAQPQLVFNDLSRIDL